MKREFDFVDCEAIEKALKDNLPDEYKVVRVWEGTMRNDKTFKVYVTITQAHDDESFFTEVCLADMKAIIGELLDVEIMDETTLEFGFALPLTSHYYND